MAVGQANHTTPLDDLSNGAQCKKVFIQRDYSRGTMVKFETRRPSALANRIGVAEFENTIHQLNTYFEEAEKASCSTYCEGCLACLTAYLIYLCSQTQYEKCLRKVAKYIAEQNEKVYEPLNLHITDPIERGFRVIEIAILDQPTVSRT